MKEVGEQWRVIADPNLDLYMNTHTRMHVHPHARMHMYTHAHHHSDMRMKNGEKNMWKRRKKPLSTSLYLLGVPLSCKTP